MKPISWNDFMDGEGIVRCKHCGRYVERSVDDDDYLFIEHGLREAWAHQRYFVACNPGKEPHETLIFHEPEPIGVTWRREAPRLLAETLAVLQGLQCN